MPDSILSLLGMARKAGKLELGEEPALGAARAKKARLLLVAHDAADNTYRRVRHVAETSSTTWCALPRTKSELGDAVGTTSCAIAALTDAGFAASLAEKLAAADPDRYGALAGELRVKADRLLQRRKEQLRHEKNLRTGKKRRG